MLKTKFTKYKDCQRGNFAVIFALALSGIVTIAGVAIDVQQIHTQKSKAQDALDAAALFYADENVQNGIGKTKQNIKSYLESSYQNDLNSELTNIGAQLTSEGHLKVTAIMNMKPLMGGILGYKGYSANIESVIALPSSTIIADANIAIVWDVSTSMTSLLPDVKSAVLSVHGKLTDNEAEGEFSIFPYSQYTSNRNHDTLLSNKDLEMDNWDIKSHIENLQIMTSVSQTTENTGAACGWEALEQANAAIDVVENDKANVIFFMHDGDGFCQADDKILEQCQTIRDRGIHLVSVRFGGFSTKEQLFKDCAADPNNYFFVNSAETALEAFFEGTFGGKIYEKYIVR